MHYSKNWLIELSVKYYFQPRVLKRFLSIQPSDSPYAVSGTALNLSFSFV